MLKLFITLLAVMQLSLTAVETRTLADDKGKPRAQYTYQDKVLILRTFYNYDAKGRVNEITRDNGHSENNFEGVTERFITTMKHNPYSDAVDSPIEVIHIHLDDITHEEKLISHTIDTYDKNNEHIVQRESIDSEGTYVHITFDNAAKIQTFLRCPKQGEQERMVFEYDKQGRLTSVSKETKAGIVELIYDKRGIPILRRVNYEEPNPYADEPWFEAANHSIECWTSLFKNMQNALAAISLVKPEDDFLVTQTVDDLAKQMMDPWSYNMLGFYNHPERYGLYGHGEVNDKVRVTLINGILNDPADHMQNLDLFCTSHGGVNIHYIFRPCSGYTLDVLRALAAKTGFLSPQAYALAAKWKMLIAEMGGPEGGGEIYHYAHSIGGTDTIRAMSLMTPEELKMIHVCTVGSATIIPSRDFHSVINYTSLRDGVSQLTDPLGYFSGLHDPEAKVVYVDTLWGTPIIDHLITNESYSEVLENHGRMFVEKYGSLAVLAKQTSDPWSLYGHGEANDRVRVTLINGVLNDPADQKQNLDLLCNSHGGVNIHYILRPDDGHTLNLLRAIATKSGFISPQADALATKWKMLIAEMGGPEGSGEIYHYAHSIGGTDTVRAMSLMTPEELKMIHVCTLGSATMIPSGDFHSVINYTSVRDGVSLLGDPLGYISGLLATDSNVVYVDTLLGGLPLVEDLSTAYSEVVKKKGEIFVEKYGSVAE